MRRVAEKLSPLLFSPERERQETNQLDKSVCDEFEGCLHFFFFFAFVLPRLLSRFAVSDVRQMRPCERSVKLLCPRFVLGIWARVHEERWPRFAGAYIGAFTDLTVSGKRIHSCSATSPRATCYFQYIVAVFGMPWMVLYVYCDQWNGVFATTFSRMINICCARSLVHQECLILKRSQQKNAKLFIPLKQSFRVICAKATR